MQTPNPLPDRKALAGGKLVFRRPDEHVVLVKDDIVFDAIGLTKDERDEVYRAVCQLVKDRLEKARSLKG